MDEPLALVVKAPGAPERVPLIVWLPDTEPLQLFHLAEVQPVVEDHEAADLCTGRTYLTWRSLDAGLEVRLDIWDLADLMALNAHELVIVFIGPGQAVATKLRTEPCEATASARDLQAAATSTNSNWKPLRICSEEEMARAEGQVDDPAPGLFVPRIAALTIGS